MVSTNFSRYINAFALTTEVNVLNQKYSWMLINLISESGEICLWVHHFCSTHLHLCSSMKQVLFYFSQLLEMFRVWFVVVHWTFFVSGARNMCTPSRGVLHLKKKKNAVSNTVEQTKQTIFRCEHQNTRNTVYIFSLSYRWNQSGPVK